MLVISAALVCAGMFVDGANARSGRSCATLKGKRLTSNRNIKVIEQGNEYKGVAYVCVPNGPVRAAGAASSFLGGSEYSISVAAVAGSWVALSFADVDGAFPGEEIGKAINAASGKSYRYWGYLPNVTAMPPEVHALERVQLNASGQMALAVHDEGTEQVVGVEASGKRHVLDSAPIGKIPPASLTLMGRTVQWVDAGSTRTATI